MIVVLFLATIPKRQCLKATKEELHTDSFLFNNKWLSKTNMKHQQDHSLEIIVLTQQTEELKTEDLMLAKFMYDASLACRELTCL